VACAPEELAAGAKRLVLFDRKVVCAWCAGIRGIRPHCPHCGGAGIRTERDVVEVVVRPGTPPGATLKFADMGNEDINGVRGPLTVRITAGIAQHRA
jgi:DnaJ-class molecular chaperone